MVYLSILDTIDKLDDYRTYTITFSYLFHRIMGKWIYIICGKKFRYGGVLPGKELKDFLCEFDHTISGHVHSFEGDHLKRILERVGEYIDRYGT